MDFLSSDTTHNSERPWIRELWCCKYTNTCTARARSFSCRNSSASLEAKQDECQIRGQLVCVSTWLCPRLWGFIWIWCKCWILWCRQCSWKVSVSLLYSDFFIYLKSSVWSFDGLLFHGSKVNLTSGSLFAIELFLVRTPRKCCLMGFLNWCARNQSSSEL